MAKIYRVIQIQLNQSVWENVHMIVWLTEKAYLSAITARRVFTYNMAAKIDWHRYGTKLRHCHLMSKSKLSECVDSLHWLCRIILTNPSFQQQQLLKARVDCCGPELSQNVGRDGLRRHGFSREFDWKEMARTIFGESQQWTTSGLTRYDHS